MNLDTVIKARAAIGSLVSGYNVPEEIQAVLAAAHGALLAYERGQPPEEVKAAYLANAGPREEWEIA